MEKNNTQLTDLEQSSADDAVETIDFRSWYALRSSKIPTHHREEILSADFKARGLKDEATLVEFDNALSMYGIKLD